MRRCARCGEEKPTTEFGWKNKSRGWLRSYCRACGRAKSKEHYEANKDAYKARASVRRKELQPAIRVERMKSLLAYLRTHPCIDCGETDPTVLEFDHRSDKRFDISRKYAYLKWQTVLDEIEKCDVRCANCHRRKTARERLLIRYVLLALR